MRVKIPFANKVVQVPKGVQKAMPRLETMCGRCAMVGCYNIIHPASTIVIPMIQIGVTIVLSDRDAKSAQVSFLTTFEKPRNNESFGYNFTLRREQETINGRVAMIGITLLYLLGIIQ